LKRVTLLTLFIVILCFSSLPILDIKANPLLYKSLQIEQPKPKTYNTNSIPVSVIIRIPDEIPAPTTPNVTTIAWMKYSLDGNENISITQIEEVLAWDIVGSIGYMIIATTTLSELTNGNHSLTVYAQKTSNEVSSDSVDFTIDIEDPTPTPTPSYPQTTLPSTLEIVLIVILVVVTLGLALNIIKKRRS
jgi:hypothetical protein